MITVYNGEVWGFEHAIRGMRNPMNSWDKDDSRYEVLEDGINSYTTNFVIGDNNLDLMKKLYNGGPEHRKYMRQIFICMDIVAPLYWWKEFDTYKVGTTSNSCSTMHKIHSKEFTVDDFSHEHLLDISYNYKWLEDTIKYLNDMRNKYIETKDKKYWWQMIQMLPSSYNQRRTVTMSYENAVNIIQQRRNHKLDEWREFCNILSELPYLSKIMEACDGR